MAGRARDYETKVILRRLLTFVIAFYALYYVVGAVLAAITGQPVTATIPFDHVEFGTGKGRPLLTFLTTVITYTLGLALVVIIIQTSANAWDYAVTTSLLHLLLASIVCFKFSVNWVWWVTVVVGTVWMAIAGEALNLCLCDMRRLARVMPSDV